MNRKRIISRSLLLLAVLAAALGLQSAGRWNFTRRDKAFYANEASIAFVRPGLVFKITAAKIATDGTVTANLTMTDAQGIALDWLGVNTPGVVSPSLMIATIPKGQTQYTAYTTRIQTSPITKASATQASTDTGGVFVQNADGSYTYTFGTKAPSGWDANATHTVAIFGSRDLTAFGLGIDRATNVFSFVPAGGAVTVTRDVIRSASCNSCHDQLNFHGGNRIGVEACVLCHTPQTTDPDTGNTVNFPVLVHKIHMGASLPSVIAGTPYQIIGFNQGVSDFSDVVYPSDVRRCETCHDQNSGAKQAKAYLTNPNQAACGSCHDNVNFATGANHVSLPQPDSSQCSSCHIPQGDLEFDASIKGAHTIQTESATLPGIVLHILGVDNGTAGSKPAVRFTVQDNSAANIPPASLKTGSNRLALVLGGPAQDPGYTNFGSDVATGGYVSEDATNATCGQDGTCTFTFTHAIPATAKGTFYVGMEGRRQATLLAGTPQAQTVEYGAQNVVFNFSVDGSAVQARRVVVDLAKCNACHTKLSLHGENRNQIEMCVICHNPSETDKTTKAQATVAADKVSPYQSVNFALMIHKIHTGADQKNLYGKPYVVVGFGGSHNEWSNVEFPAMTSAGAVGASNDCDLCHVNGSEQNFPLGLQNVTTPQGFTPLTPPTTAACTACHASQATAVHAQANTTALGESCEVCHGAGADFNVSKVHAQ
jgi:OmcA/MtrC family decaheme c-type cytochrome